MDFCPLDAGASGNASLDDLETFEDVKASWIVNGTCFPLFQGDDIKVVLDGMCSSVHKWDGLTRIIVERAKELGNAIPTNSSSCLELLAHCYRHWEAYKDKPWVEGVRKKLFGKFWSESTTLRRLMDTVSYTYVFVMKCGTTNLYREALKLKKIDLDKEEIDLERVELDVSDHNHRRWAEGMVDLVKSTLEICTDPSERRLLQRFLDDSLTVEERV
eukprot:Protomagalhaensia_wolfi_Nauph_80__1730@NODE_2076_length_1223_cov_10_046453_g421_i1_p1_GENE_NODE_2076_length_1223_cov_10_046453_g421_i1NODE_2076_length_1223_cov_10_046453_g421_i1_p1_ORF_typecomplete_len216_score48_98DUF535/PF04393_13/0_022DUF535/PF04393_13/3_4e03_NODE_2076_length_1223_cov_10_046453_g421_i14781125